MTQQVLYVDYIGGQFEYWHDSDGRSYRYYASDTGKILAFYRRNGFTKLVATDSARERVNHNFEQFKQQKWRI